MKGGRHVGEAPTEVNEPSNLPSETISETIPGLGRWEWHVPTNRLTWSDELKQIYGVDREPDGELEFLSLIHPEDRRQVDANTTSFLTAGDAFSHAFRVLRPDGSVRHVIDRGVIERDAHGAAVRIVGINLDVTEQRNLFEGPSVVEERLSAAQRLELALEAGAILGTWHWDVPADVFVADERFAHAFDVEVERCLAGLPLSEVMASIHEQDRPRVSAAIQEALGRGGAYRCEYRVRRREGGWRWIEARGRVDMGRTGEPARFPGVLVDIDEHHKAKERLAEANVLLQTFMQAVPGVVYAKDLEGRMLVANRGVAELVGKPLAEIVGRTDAEFLDDAAEAAVVMNNDRRIMDTGEQEQLEERVTYSNGDEAWWHSTKAPLRDSAGHVVGLIGSSIDITARRQAEEQRALLLNELHHRVKNILTVVQSLAAQTFRSASSIDQGLQDYQDRLAALARVHDILTEQNWSSADLREIVEQHVAVHQRGERIRFDGPSYLLPSKHALSIALALHELGTNAVKYGALSNDSGRVELVWTLDPERQTLHMQWEEVGGPPVRRPTRRGFGSRLLERALAADLDGSVDVDYRPTGLVCKVAVSASGPLGSPST